MSTYPKYIEPEMRTTLDRSRMARLWGNLNCYTCESCNHQNWTTDVDEGTTPYLIDCEACGCTAKSAFYRIHPANCARSTRAFYRPDSLYGFNESTREHLRQGGLVLRDLNGQERGLFDDSRP